MRYDDHKEFRHNPRACIQTLRDGKQKWVRVPEVTEILSRIKDLDDIISDRRRITSMQDDLGTFCDFQGVGDDLTGWAIHPVVMRSIAPLTYKLSTPMNVLDETYVELASRAIGICPHFYLRFFVSERLMGISTSWYADRQDGRTRRIYSSLRKAYKEANVPNLSKAVEDLRGLMELDKRLKLVPKTKYFSAEETVCAFQFDQVNPLFPQRIDLKRLVERHL